MMFKKGDTIIFDSGRESLVIEVKEGGMGIVYICKASKYSSGEFVFKTFKEKIFKDNKDVIESFINECKIWINLGRHPFIIEAKSIEMVDGQPFVEMAHCYNRNLSETIIQDNLPYHVYASVRIALEISLAMIHANGKIKNFVHRDLKPSNVLMGVGVNFSRFYKDNQGIFYPIFRPPWQAFVTDFGLSKVASGLKEDILPIERELNGTKNFLFSKIGTICGTPPYMSPEQCLGQALDQRSDIYALGCILYEMLTGRFVFNARSADELIYHHIHKQPLIAKDINPRIPDVVNNIVMRCLAKDADSRFNSFSEVFTALYTLFKLQPGLSRLYSDIFKGIMYERKYDDHIRWEINHLLVAAYKFFQLHKDDEARQCIEKAKNLYPERIGAYYFNLVRFCFPKSGDNDEKILQKIRDCASAKDAIEVIKKGIDLNPDFLPSHWTPYNELADRYMRLGMKVEALNTLNQWLLVDRNNPKVYEYLYAAYEEVGLLNEALDALNKWVSIDEKDPKAYLRLGEYCVKVNNQEEAIEAFKIGEALAQYPSHLYPYSRICGKNLAELYPVLGNYELAYDLLEKHKYYRELMELHWDIAKFDLVYQYFEKLLKHNCDNTVEYPFFPCSWKDREYSENKLKHILDMIRKRKVRDFYLFYQFTQLAYILEKKNRQNASLKIYQEVLEKYKLVPTTKRKPSKSNYFRKYLPMVIKVLEEKIFTLENESKVLNGKQKNMALAFIITNGPMRGHKFVIKGGDTILIGREQGMNIYISEDEFVSRKHARVSFENDSYFLEDLNSKNGTYLNRSRIEKKTKISDSDIITIGHTELEFRIKS